MIFVKIGDKKYPATITNSLSNANWAGRETKSIKVEMSYAEAAELFVDDVEWSVIIVFEYQREVINENNEVTYESVAEERETDCSEFSMAGEITDHRDGFVTVKMSKHTAEEILAMIKEGLAL